MLIILCACLTGLFGDLGANPELSSWEGKGGSTAFGRAVEGPSCLPRLGNASQTKRGSADAIFPQQGIEAVSPCY